MIGGPCDQACRRQWEPPAPTRPMESHHPSKIYSLHTLRHPSCLTEIPSYTASGHIPFSSDHSGHRMAWFDEGPCGSHVFPPCRRGKNLSCGAAIKMTIHMSSLHHLPPKYGWQTADVTALFFLAGVLCFAYNLCLQVSANPSYVYLRQPMKRAELSRQHQSLPS